MLQFMKSPHREGGVGELLAIALPMVVSSACETLMMFVDRLFLSRLGPEYMNAAMGGGMTCFMFMTFFVGLTGYFILNPVREQVRPGVRQSTEETLVDTANLLAEILRDEVKAGSWPRTRWAS